MCLMFLLLTVWTQFDPLVTPLIPRMWLVYEKYAAKACFTEGSRKHRNTRRTAFARIHPSPCGSAEV